MKRRLFLTLVASATAASATMFVAPVVQAADNVKIGFLVKQPEEPWFQDEWKFAEMAAKEKGFTLVKIGAPSGEKVMSAIDNLAAQKAQGFVICTPDVKLGPGIVATVEFRILPPKIEPQRAQQLSLKPADEADNIADPGLRRIYRNSRLREAAGRTKTA